MGTILVKPAVPGERPITTEEILAAIDEAREERTYDIMKPGS